MRPASTSTTFRRLRSSLHSSRWGSLLEEYQQNATLRLAVERAFAIVGEALAQLARVDEQLANRISEFRSIIAFRNVLIHEYAQVDDRLVWGVVETKLPILIQEVDTLMKEPD